jgi:O-antigen/teichoic acid export membrane protein
MKTLMMINSWIEKFLQSDILQKISAAFILKVIGTLSAFILYVTISRLYGADTMGAYSLFLALLTIFGIFSTLGLTSSVMRFVPDFIANKKLSELHHFKKIAFLLSSLISIILGLVLFLSADYLAEIFFHQQNNQWIIELIAILLPFYALFLIGNEFARASGKTTLFEYFRSIHIQLTALLLLLLLKWSFPENSLPVYITAFLYLLGFIIVWAVNLRFLSAHQDKEKKQSAKITTQAVLKISLPMMLTSFSVIIMERIDTLMISYFYDNSEVGVYNVALKLSVLILFLIVPVNAVLIPKISAAFWQQDKEKLNLYIHKASAFMLLSAILVFIILVSFADLLLALFGAEFTAAKQAMLFLSVAYLVNASFGLAEHMLNLSGNEKKLTAVFSFGLLINIGLNYLLIPRYGINGAAIATMCSMIIWNILAGWMVYKHLGLQILYIPFLSRHRR